MSEMPAAQETYTIRPVGYVRQGEEGSFRLEILEPFRPALQQLEHFSHVNVFWWADQHDNASSRAVTHSEPPYAPGKMTGVFASRSELRPNPIALTTCPLLDVDVTGGSVLVPYIDAFDGTPIIDLKAYFPMADRVKNPRLPDWLADLPEWMPDLDWMPDSLPDWMFEEE